MCLLLAVNSYGLSCAQVSSWVCEICGVAVNGPESLSVPFCLPLLLGITTSTEKSLLETENKKSASKLKAQLLFLTIFTK